MPMKLKELNMPVNILLAEDDLDDRFFFDKVLAELPFATRLTTVNDGEHLMDYLTGVSASYSPVDILFLDLSMPHKTGYECLAEIKANEELKGLPVVMFTSSFTSGIEFEQELINTLNRMGAEGFIRKPNNFEELKKLIEDTLNRLVKKPLINFKN
jgi:CheY-like chemotaxis protein